MNEIKQAVEELIGRELTKSEIQYFNEWYSLETWRGLTPEGAARMFWEWIRKKLNEE